MHSLWNFLAAVSSLSLRDLFAPFLPSSPVTDPVAIFLVIMAIMLVAPLLFEWFRLPGIVGLILAGVIVGLNGFGLLERDTTIALLVMAVCSWRRNRLKRAIANPNPINAKEVRNQAKKVRS